MLEKKGFTLIELLVVIAIIGILAGTAIVNFGKNADRDVRQEKDRLTTFLREAQSKALTGDTEGIKSSDLNGKRLCGFGVRQQAGSNNLESFYVYTTDIDARDCSTNWKNYAISGHIGVLDTLYPPKDTTYALTGSLFFISPNGAVDCGSSVCDWPASISVNKGESKVKAFVDQSGKIY